MSANEHLITTVEQLEALYGQPFGRIKTMLY